MDIIFQRFSINDKYLNLYETPHLLMGFTEMDFSIDDLSQKLKPYNQVELEQVHGNKILQSSHISLDMETGDGILLDQTFYTNAYPTLIFSGGTDSRITITYAERICIRSCQIGFYA